MKPGKTELRLNAEIEKRGALFAVLLDPDTSDEAAFVKAGAMAAENGADLLLVGGSYLGNFTLPKQVAALKAAVDLPVVLFPGGASQVVPGFDAMLFMTLVSGRNPNYLIDEQVRGGALVRALNMEAIPTAYQLIYRDDFTAAFKVGNRTLISVAKLAEWIDRQCGGNDDDNNA